MTYDEIVDRFTGWNVTNNQPSYDQIHASAAVVGAKELRKIALTLGQILNRLDNLGNDGIHVVIKHEAAQIRKRDLLRRQRLAAKRRAARAARLAAAR